MDKQPSQIREERIAAGERYNEKYIFAPLRFIGFILFLLLVYLFFKV
jgi:hypothetical protein